MKYNNPKIVEKNINKHLARVKKLAYGRSTIIPNYGKITAYRNSKGIRKYSLSCSSIAPNGGNLSINILSFDMQTHPEYFKKYELYK